MDFEKCANCLKSIPSTSIELHTIHCRRNYLQCDCGEIINRQNLAQHNKDFHTELPCQYCNVSLLPKALAQHGCPQKPKPCQFCEAEFPPDQLPSHLFVCGSRTDQCPRCRNFIQIRDFDHHTNQVDCLGTKDPYQESINRITEEVIKELGEGSQDIEAEILKRIAEDQDRIYAEEVYKRMIQESPRRDSEIESREAFEEKERHRVIDLRSEVSVDSWADSEDQSMNEVILKSLRER